MNLIVRIRKIIRSTGKPLMLALYGAGGCLLGAMIGEGVFAFMPTALPPPKKSIPPQAVCLLIDCSGSMDGGKLGEVKLAARAFLDRQDSSWTMISVVGFGSRAHIAIDLTGDYTASSAKIDSLFDGGSTDMETGLHVAAKTLADTNWVRNIMLFTDGMPDSESTALQAAQQCLQSGIRLIAIGTGDAKTDYLRDLTQDPRLVFKTRSGDFESAFQKAEQAIYVGQIITTDAGEGVWRSLVRVAIWSAVVSVGLTLALVVGQNRYLRRRILSIQEGVLGASAGLAAGVIAGSVSQILFGFFSRVTVLAGIGRIVAWAFLGGLLGLAMSFYIRNLKPTRASIGGAIGGSLGAIAFFLAVAATGDRTGRLAGTAILGFLIGLMVIFAEVFTRDAWLVVKWPGGEESTLSLGAKPIVLGSSSESDIYLQRDQGFPDITAKVKLTGGQIEFEDYTKKSKHMLHDGNKLVVGGLTIEVHSK